MTCALTFPFEVSGRQAAERSPSKASPPSARKTASASSRRLCAAKNLGEANGPNGRQYKLVGTAR